jgi:hypothetical protein
MAATPVEREDMLKRMQAVSHLFYIQARAIGNHPFIEFAGLMNEYIKACHSAHDKGIDFTNCNTHSGQELPLEDFEVKYINEKLECIFTGRSVMSGESLCNHVFEQTGDVFCRRCGEYVAQPAQEPTKEN